MTETGDAAPALDFSAFDHGVRVQDDLFRHVNGTWLANAEIPADKPLAGAFMNLRDRAEEAVRDIITTIEADCRSHPDEAKIADLYASFMDADAVEAAGRGTAVPAVRRDRRGDARYRSWPGCSAGSPAAGSAAWSGWTPSPTRVTRTAT